MNLNILNNLSKKILFYVIFIILIFLSALCMHFNYPLWTNYVNRLTTSNNFRVHQILSWTDFFSDHQFMNPSFQNLNCPVSSCEVTSNRSEAVESGAIIIHWRDVNLQDLPTKRPGQRIFLLNFESPHHVSISDLQELQDLVNWTISYRLDSDIVSSYGKIVQRTVQVMENYLNATKDISKKRMASWMVSNCNVPSMRRRVVSKLQRLGVNIDEYGGCPTGNDSFRKKDRSEAYDYLSKRYKFYMAFENSLCKDYATEKIYQPLYHGMIPIVYGGANYKKLLPEKSYIDVLDYSSLQELAKHLRHIESDEEALKSYHEWRKNFQVVEYENNNRFFCDLCANLHNSTQTPKVGGGNLTTWWTAGDCFAPILSDGMLNLSVMAVRRRDLYS